MTGDFAQSIQERCLAFGKLEASFHKKTIEVADSTLSVEPTTNRWSTELIENGWIKFYLPSSLSTALTRSASLGLVRGE